MEIKNKTILCIAAHPDDDILGCGGTLAKFTNTNNIFVSTFTNGVGARKSNSKDVERRRRHFYKSLNTIGIPDCNQMSTSGYNDNEMDKETRLQITKSIENMKEFCKPDIVFTHFKDCLNIDHRLVSYCTYVAFRPQPHEKNVTIFEYEVSSSTEYSNCSFNPNVFVDISEYIDKKIQAFKCYEDEIREYPHPRSLEMIRSKSRYWGSHIGVNNSEAFVCRKMLL